MVVWVEKNRKRFFFTGHPVLWAKAWNNKDAHNKQYAELKSKIQNGSFKNMLAFPTYLFQLDWG